MSQAEFSMAHSTPTPTEDVPLYDPAAWTALPLMERGILEVGQEITPEDCPPHHLLAILSGKIRILDYLPDGTVYTRAILEAGDLWDRAAWQPLAHATWVVADTARLGAMPVSAVQQYPFLLVCAERTQQKLQQEASQPPLATVATPVGSSVPVAAPVNAPTDPRRSLPTPTGKFRLHILKDLLSSLSIPLDSSLSGDGLAGDLESLMDHLTAYGVKSQILTLTWGELRKLPPPWVIEDEQGALHCVTRIKQHEILTRSQGKTSLLLLDRRGGPKTWHILVPQSPRQKSRSQAMPSHQTPFTLAWYSQLLFKGGFISTQMLVASLLIQVFALGMPIFYMVIFDRVFGRQNLDTLDIIAIGMGLILISDLTVRSIRSLVLTQLLIWVDRVSTDTILDAIFRMPLVRMSREVIQQCSEMYQELTKANEAVVSLFLISSLDALFSCIMILVLMNLHLQMALISLASLVPLSLLTLLSTPHVKRRAQQFAKAQRANQVCLSETLQNWETLHSHNALSNAKNRLRQMTQRSLHANLWARFDSISSNNLGGFIGSVGSLVTLYYGAHEVLEGQISYGAYAAINLMSRNVVGSVQKLFSSFMQFQENMAKLEKYQDVATQTVNLSEDSLPSERPRIVVPSVQGQIEFRNVRFYYPSDTEKSWSLGPINLTIDAGQKVVITGNAGSGKTTLIRLIQGLYPPTEGAITLDGYRLNEFDAESRNRLIGVALQRPAFLSGTLLENLTLEDPDAPMKDVLDAIRLAQLDSVIDKMPLGLDSPVAPMAANLPTTVAIRLALARVFINKPSILVIDKALDALEPALQAAIFSPMLQTYAQSTCLLMSDFLPIHQQADRILVMRDGLIVEDGTFASLIQAKGYYYHLHVVDKTFTKQG